MSESLATKQQKAADRRQLLLQKIPQLIEVVKRGQLFYRYTEDGVEPIFLQCRDDPLRLHWQVRDASDPLKETSGQGTAMEHSLGFDVIEDILVSTANPIFEQHRIDDLTCCLSFIASPSRHKKSSKHATTAPQSLHIRARDRLHLEVWIIAIQFMLKSQGYGLDGDRAMYESSANSIAAVNPTVEPRATTTTATTTSSTIPIAQLNAEIFSKYTPKQLVRLLMKGDSRIHQVDVVTVINSLIIGLPFSRYHTTTCQLEDVQIFWYYDGGKGVVYWGQRKKPVGVLPLREVTDMLLGKQASLASPVLDHVDPACCFTLKSKKVELCLIAKDMPTMSLFTFVMHRLLTADKDLLQDINKDFERIKAQAALRKQELIKQQEQKLQEKQQTKTQGNGSVSTSSSNSLADRFAGDDDETQQFLESLLSFNDHDDSTISSLPQQQPSSEGKQHQTSYSSSPIVTEEHVKAYLEQLQRDSSARRHYAADVSTYSADSTPSLSEFSDINSSDLSQSLSSTSSVDHLIESSKLARLQHEEALRAHHEVQQQQVRMARESHEAESTRQPSRHGDLDLDEVRARRMKIKDSLARSLDQSSLDIDATDDDGDGNALARSLFDLSLDEHGLSDLHDLENGFESEGRDVFYTPLRATVATSRQNDQPKHTAVAGGEDSTQIRADILDFGEIDDLLALDLPQMADGDDGDDEVVLGTGRLCSGDNDDDNDDILNGDGHVNEGEASIEPQSALPNPIQRNRRPQHEAQKPSQQPQQQPPPKRVGAPQQRAGVGVGTQQQQPMTRSSASTMPPQRGARPGQKPPVPTQEELPRPRAARTTAADRMARTNPAPSRGASATQTRQQQQQTSSTSTMNASTAVRGQPQPRTRSSASLPQQQQQPQSQSSNGPSGPITRSRSSARAVEQRAQGPQGPAMKPRLGGSSAATASTDHR